MLDVKGRLSLSRILFFVFIPALTFHKAGRICGPHQYRPLVVPALQHPCQVTFSPKQQTQAGCCLFWVYKASTLRVDCEHPRAWPLLS